MTSSREKIKKNALQTLTAKQAWALVHPLILEKTAKSFHLEITNGRNGRKIIHAADGKVFVERDGIIRVARKRRSISIVNHVDVSVTACLYAATGLSDLSYEELNSPVIEYIQIKYKEGWSDNYQKRADSHLMWQIMTSLPEENRRIAYASGCVFFSSISIGVRNLNLIAKHIETLRKVYLDDRRLLSSALQMLNQGHIFARPDSAIKETKDLLLSRGLSECGWRKFIRLSSAEKQGWILPLIGNPNFDANVILMLNLIAIKKINVRIYNPQIITNHIADDARFLPENERIKYLANISSLLEIVLREVIKEQQINKGRLSNRLLEKFIDKIGALFDYLNANPQLNIPRGVGYTWLKRQSDIWHAEAVTREIDSLTAKSDWRERIPNDLSEIKMQDNFIATMLTSTEAFYLESNKMHHCVSYRWETAYAGRCCVFHLHDTATDAHATLDLRKNDYDDKYFVYECRSFCNEEITPELEKFSRFIASYFDAYFNGTQKLAA